MRELAIVLRREFLERVRSRSFLLSTILTPVFFLLVLLLPVLSTRWAGGEDRFLGIVDESTTGVGAELAAALSEPAGVGDDRVYASVITSPAPETLDSLVQAVVSERLDGFIIIPEDVVEGGALQYRARTVTDVGFQRRVRDAATAAVQARRLETAGIDAAILAEVMAPVQLNAARLTRQGETGEGAEAGMLFSIMVGFALYMLILLYGVQVLQSVQEEKTNRIAEILVSSIRASHLMLGKVLGVGLAALLQIAIWIGLAVALIGPMQPVLSASGAEPGMVSGLFSRIELSLVAVVVAYLLLGFFLYASLFAAAGAAAASSEDAQRFTFPLIMPLIIPMMMTGVIVSAPQSTLALVLGWIPLTMPLAMPMRIGAGGTGAVETAATLVLLLASVLVLGSLAGKIYRIGILSTGKRPSFAELLRWLRTA